jgi:hypothetical protein
MYAEAMSDIQEDPSDESRGLDDQIRKAAERQPKHRAGNSDSYADATAAALRQRGVGSGGNGSDRNGSDRNGGRGARRNDLDHEMGERAPINSNAPYSTADKLDNIPIGNNRDIRNSFMAVDGKGGGEDGGHLDSQMMNSWLDNNLSSDY